MFLVQRVALKLLTRVRPNLFSIDRSGLKAPRWVDHAPHAAPPHTNGEHDAVWSGFVTRNPHEAKKLLAAAEEAVQGRITLFRWKVVSLAHTRSSHAYDADYPDEDWPTRFYGDIDVYYRPQRPSRDIKALWEADRFQYLLPLAAAWNLTNEARFSETARTAIEAWLNHVRYPFGVQWSSNLEVGLRALSWMRCHTLLHDDAPGWDASFQDRLLSALHQHLIHLERELTVHHTGGNHLLGEASALFICAHAYPQFREAARWKRKAVRILNRLVPRLFLPDGVYAEQTTGYLKFVCEFLLPVLDVERRSPAGIAAEVFRSVGLGLKFAASLTRDSSRVPHIGDSDTGSAIGWNLSDYWNFSPLVASAAVILRDTELAAFVPSFPAESYLLLGDPGVRVFEELRARAVDGGSALTGPTVREFPYGGYQVVRTNHFNVVFDCGPLGMAPAFAHGHEDTLAIRVDYLGTPLLDDCGTYIYNGPSEWREFFRSHRGHNTAAVVGERMARPTGTFRWATPLRVTRFPPVTSGRWTILRAALHWKGSVQSRFALLGDGAWFMVLDRFDGEGFSEVEWNFNFHPAWDVYEHGERAYDVVSAKGRVTFSVSAATPVVTELFRGACDPPAGWHSRYYGRKDPAAALRFTISGAFPIFGGAVIAAEDSYGPRAQEASEFPPELADGLAAVRAIHA